jgi:hypothetical protein
MAKSAPDLKIVEPETGARWARGFPAPKGTTAEAVWAAMQAKGRYFPEQIMEDSKQSAHPLHAAFWSEGDQVWATRGRMEYARKIVSSLITHTVVRGRVVETRAVEFVRQRWVPMTEIISDPDLDDAYQQDILRQAEQLHAKLARYFELRRREKI